MARKDQFPSIDPNYCSYLAQKLRKKIDRQISSIHIHCTDKPDHDTFYSYAKMHGGKAAGQEMSRRMWSYHANTLNWDDIAQHVSIDPEGLIWIGRNWDKRPASSRSQNGNDKRGPFMIEMIGLFDAGKDRFAGEQRDAVFALIAGVQDAWDLADNDIIFHNELTDRKTCPGTAINRGNFLEGLAEWKRDNPAVTPTTPTDNNPAAPLPANQTEPTKPQVDDDTKAEVKAVIKAAQARWEAVEDGRTRGIGSNPGEELPGCSAVGPGAEERSSGVTGERSWLTGKSDQIKASDFRRLRKHVVMLEEGLLRKEPYLGEELRWIEEIKTDLTQWVNDLHPNVTPRIMLWAHGGLNPVDGAMTYAHEMHGWWMEHNIYPIYFVWDTGLLSTITQVLTNAIRDAFGGERGVSFNPLPDRDVEAIVRKIGGPFWTTTKNSAERASSGMAPGGGADHLARMLEGLFADLVSRKPELHAAGHSAGAVFHGHFVEKLKACNLTLDSMTLLAPACTTTLFKKQIAPLIGADKTIRRCRVFNLHRGVENSDPTVPVYGRSLLYLVSNGFERKEGVPLLGLEESVNRDPEMRNIFGLDGQEPLAELLLTPIDGGGDEPERQSKAKVHGAFDNDHATLRSILHTIAPELDPADVDNPSITEDDVKRGGGGSLFTPIETQIAEFLPTSPSPPPAGGAAKPIEAAQLLRWKGRKRALCIGIDEYIGITPLKGCKNDVRLWRDLFDQAGFDVRELVDHQTRGQEIHRKMREAIEATGPGDILAIHYSGHGTRVPDLDGDEKDLQDEALVPVDGVSEADFLVDDDRLLLLDGLHRDAHCTLFFDCCHSHTSTRLAEKRMDHTERFIELSSATKAAYKRNRSFMRGRGRSLQHRDEGSMNHVLFSGCRESQTAKESGGNGWFSLVATDLIGRGKHLTNDALHKAIGQEFQKRGYSARDQTPMLDGPFDLKEAPLLGGAFG